MPRIGNAVRIHLGDRPKRRAFLVAGASALAVRSRVLGAQQKAPAVIGFLHFGSPGPFSGQVDDFRRGLVESGYVEGQNVAIEYRWAEGNYDRLPALAADLVRRGVTVIAAVSGASALAAKYATPTIPIVFMTGTDPVADGLVASLARPGGNLTGVGFLFIELHAKRLDLLSELLPQARTIALLVNPDSYSERIVRNVQSAMRARGLQFSILNAATEAELDAAFATLGSQHADGLLVGSDGFFDSRHKQIVALASSHAIPAIYPWRLYVDAGGLISYGADVKAVTRQLGLYAGKVLKGAKPADLPVEQPTKFEMVVNLKAAKALGLTVPQLLLQQADEVIE